MTIMTTADNVKGFNRKIEMKSLTNR